MAISDDDDQMFNKVEGNLAATALVCQLCDEVIAGGCKSLSVGLFGCRTLDKKLLGRVEVITTTHAGKSRHESQSGAMQVERHGQVQVHRPLFADG